MNKINVTQKDFEDLYNDSALTWEGLDTSDENLEAVKEWLQDCGCELLTDTFYVTSGKDMNEFCGGLTGSNAYPNDCNIVSIKLSDIKDYAKIILRRFEVGGRWFDDVVDNNRRREGIEE